VSWTDLLATYVRSTQLNEPLPSITVINRRSCWAQPLSPLRDIPKAHQSTPDSSLFRSHVHLDGRGSPARSVLETRMTRIVTRGTPRLVVERLTDWGRRGAPWRPSHASEHPTLFACIVHKELVVVVGSCNYCRIGANLCQMYVANTRLSSTPAVSVVAITQRLQSLLGCSTEPEFSTR